MNRNSQIRQKCLKSCGKLHQVLMNYRNCCKQMKKYKLGEIATIINGVSYNPKEIIDDGIRILRGGNIQENDLKLEDNDVFLPFSYKNASNQIQWGDTIIVASTGSSITLGKVATCFETLPNTQIGAFLRIIRPKDKKWAMLISMWLHSSTFKDYILKQAKGTSINNIRKDYLEEFTLLWSENEVNGISRLYLNIANKIALNRAINHNLEAMVKQLYDYWFVQFDFPNAEGKPYKSSGGKMVYNDKLKREIPEGWEVRQLGNLCSFRNGINYTKDEVGESYSIVNVRNISATSIILDTEHFDVITIPSSKASKYILTKKDIIIARSGCPGATRLLQIPNNTLFCGFIICCTPFEGNLRGYLTFQLKILEGSSATTSGGSILQNVDQDTLKSLLVAIPPIDLLMSFDKFLNDSIGLLCADSIKIKKLSMLRNSLLPLLMNGQVSLNYDLSHD